MNSAAESNYQFSALLKRTSAVTHEVLELFPSLSEIAFNSRVFPDYAECIQSCKLLMEDVTTSINEGSQSQKFMVGAEVNPSYSGTPTISVDWDDEEIARFWVYDKNLQGAPKIEAICRSSIFAIPKMLTPRAAH